MPLTGRPISGSVIGIGVVAGCGIEVGAMDVDWQAASIPTIKPINKKFKKKWFKKNLQMPPFGRAINGTSLRMQNNAAIVYNKSAHALDG